MKRYNTHYKEDTFGSIKKLTIPHICEIFFSKGNAKEQVTLAESETKGKKTCKMLIND